MNVGIYAEYINPLEGGASTFLDTVLKDLSELKNNYGIVICYRGSVFGKTCLFEGKIQYINTRAYKRRHYFSIMVATLKKILTNIKNRLFLNRLTIDGESLLDRIAKDYRIDIYWITHPAYLELSTPYIYTVWDLGHRTLLGFPEVSTPLSEWRKREYKFNEMLYRATYLLTGNEAGKREIMQNYLLDSSKIHILPFEVSSFCYGKEKKPAVELPNDYFIYPAQFWPHKNHVCIIEAIEFLSRIYNQKINMVFTGGDKGNEGYIRGLVEKYRLNKQVYFMGFVTGEELKYLYRNAKGLVYASLMGPNNLPPLESVFLGCPVIISDIEGHREMLADNAVYFDPYSPEKLASKIYDFITNNDLYNEYKEKANKVKYEIENYKYIDGIKVILEDFEKKRHRWGNDY